MKVIAIIPARYESTRFPGKPLAKILGKPMIQVVYERAKSAQYIDEVVVATDHKDIYKTVKSFGANAVMTSNKHESGTDRIAEVAEKINGDIFLNIQGDEPLISPKLIDKIVKESKENLENIVTAKTKLINANNINNPNIVKVVSDYNNNALYFSRSKIPYNRSETHCNYFKHIGIYCFPAGLLRKYFTLSKSNLEGVEMLEQLRFLENGFNMKVVNTTYQAIGVDTPEDIGKVENILEEIKSGNDKFD
ncbi:3-deoxy-manno-octulosonate cytidylyltransferase [Staphylococcus equorum]|uniref:3-deoxy-manno-octulosonate cytidylyltransferase n=1 Tax=Staphylococcus equorum TaxID=246432 RepID=UPI002DB5E0A7|nr:3-deoxy-manno-octulosonate cytidylyltransferase [Staphylococcus equorum]MEB7723123.1 3-deoxy-manno-octulosonate cytidylyltransferase [Staphylococcus equorum]